MIRLVLFLLALIGAPPAPAAAPFDPFGKVDVTGRPGDRLPMDAAFVDEHGRAVTLGELAGDRPVLLAPVYYSCPNVCSVALSSVMTTLADVPLVPGEDYVFVAWSINPREGPAEARKAEGDALRRFRAGADPGNFHFLTGSEDVVRALSDAIGFRFAWDARISEYAHTTALATVTPDGRLARWIYGVSHSPVDLRLALLEAGEGTTGGLADKLLLLCYHYDPQTGRYGPLIHSVLLASGIATVTALALLIGTLLWLERRTARRRRTGA